MKTIALLSLVLLASCGGGGGGSDSTSCSVHIQQYGDSTQAQQGDNLQDYLDRTMGAGRASVSNEGRGGSTTRVDLPAKPDPDAIVTVNFGINDVRKGVPVAEYKAALREMAPDVFITPSPPHDGYAAAMREVAKEMDRPVVDVSAFVRGLPGWEARIVDGIHPEASLYAEITEKAVGPVIKKLVEKACR